MLITEKSSLIIKILLFSVILFLCQTFAGCQTKEQKVEIALNQCQQLLDKDDVQSAGECYEKTGFANPERMTEISKVAEDSIDKKCFELYDKKNYRQSIVCFYSIIAFKPNNANVYYFLADSYLQYYKTSNNGTGDLLVLAEEAVNDGLKINPDDADLHYLYGEILISKNRIKEALSEYKQAVKIKPNEILYRIKLAITQEKLGSYWEAVTSYNQALLIDPNDTLSLYNSGMLYEKLSRVDEAIFAYEKLLKIKTKYDDAKERLERLKTQRENEKNEPKRYPGQGGSTK